MEYKKKIESLFEDIKRLSVDYPAVKDGGSFGYKMLEEGPLHVLFWFENDVKKNYIFSFAGTGDKFYECCYDELLKTLMFSKDGLIIDEEAGIPVNVLTLNTILNNGI